MGQKVKFGLLADLQAADAEPYTFPFAPAGDQRQPQTYPRRLTEAVATWRGSGIQFAFFVGDMNDSNGTDAFLKDTGSGDSVLTEIDDVVTDGATGIDGGAEPYYMWGNHDVTSYDGVGDSPTIASWFADLAGQGARSNVFPNGTTPYSYTFDIGGVRFIVFHYPSGTTIPVAELAWLDTRLGETTMPVVIFTHKQTWEDPDNILSFLFQPSDPEEFYAVVDAYKNVQAVFSGHWHQAGTDILRNDIWYIADPGSVWDDTGSDNAYFIIEIDPNAYMGDSRARANIKITGFGSHGTPKTKDFDQFVVV